MAQAVDKRSLLRDGVAAALMEIDGVAADWRFQVARVHSHLVDVERVTGDQLPWLAVVNADGTWEYTLGRQEVAQETLLVWGAMRPDATKWPGKTANQLCNELLADVRKAVALRPVLGSGWHLLPGGSLSTDVDPSGRYAFFELRLTWETRGAMGA